MSWVTWPVRIVGLALWFAKEIVVSSAAVLRDNFTPGQNSTPGIARLETRCRTDLEITLFASMITITPGTLTLGTDVVGDEQTRVLYVHGMYAADADALRAELRVMENKVLHAVRREGARS
ncbi:Na(+)/H(+) antiporter subunit E [Demequina sediminis]|jgi:multicomponent Na+:H+ antiporter subunit E|uniref:Na(+)/H(+) antiporter subunit E n=1 Tax=Demequina sediminis TaxID=1930058 RepID=A0ABP9WCT5_9MICO|nr:Na+/H+ antiporter subunit E [Demequina sediminis]BDZ60708.1 sodium:proton antiporter [Demequina sediminis]